MMHKISVSVAGKELPFFHQATFIRKMTSNGTERLEAGLPWEKSNAFSALVQSLGEPLKLLYVLHTPRGEGEAGRYQSPDVMQTDVQFFLVRFRDFLQGDARFDFWVHSPQLNGTLVWDRHNIIYGYGPILNFETILRSHGFEPGRPTVPSEHFHHYRFEFDEVARAILKEYDWERTPLRRNDEQGK